MKTKEQKILGPAEEVLDNLFFIAKVSNDPIAAREIWDAASKLNVVLSEAHLALKKVSDELAEIDLTELPGISTLWRTHSGENAPWLSNNEIGK